MRRTTIAVLIAKFDGSAVRVDDQDRSTDAVVAHNSADPKPGGSSVIALHFIQYDARQIRSALSHGKRFDLSSLRSRFGSSHKKKRLDVRRFFCLNEPR